ncbi:MAG: hypothetical protein AABZ27_00625 [Candidatus Omnitrophota bacterium]
MRALAIGDIHGAYKAMMQCFERAKFDYKNQKTLYVTRYPELGSEIIPRNIESVIVL